VYVVADMKLVVDAETYNSVQWRRVPPDEVDKCAAADTPRSSSTGKRRRDDSCAGEGEPVISTHSAVAAQQVYEAGRGTAALEDGCVTARPATTALQNDPSTAKSTTRPAPGASTRDRSALIAKLTSRLSRLKEDYQRSVTAVRQKAASLGFLRSLMMSRTSPAGVRHVPPPLTLKGKLFVSYFLNVEPHIMRTDPHLRELRSKLGSGSGSSVLFSEVGDLGARIDAEDDSCESKCALQLRSLHYRCVPSTTYVEVSAVVHNPSTSCGAYHVHLAAYSADAHFSIHCVSGRADTLKPKHTVCLRALLRVPHSAFVRESGLSLSLKVVLSYRVSHEDCGEISLNNNTAGKGAPAPVRSRYTCHTLCDSVGPNALNECSVSRSPCRVVGIVNVDMGDALRCWRTSTVVDVDGTRPQPLRRYLPTEYGSNLPSEYAVALPGCPHPTDDADKAIPVYSYGPSLRLTLHSPLARTPHLQRLLRVTRSVITVRAAQELRTALTTVLDSAFSMQAIVDALVTAVNSNSGGFKTSIVHISQHSDSADACSQAATTLAWSSPAQQPVSRDGVQTLTSPEVRRILVGAVLRSAVLQCTATAADRFTALCSALLHLRSLLPADVTLTAEDL
jgi:hypothetical protein